MSMASFCKASGYILTVVGANNQFNGAIWSVFAFADTTGQVLWHEDIVGDNA